MTPYKVQYLVRELCKRDTHLMASLVASLLNSEMDALQFESEVRIHIKDQERILSSTQKAWIEVEGSKRQLEANPYFSEAFEEHA
jgi:hypothetical protein